MSKSYTNAELVEQVYTALEASTQLGVSKRTIIRYCEEGILTARRSDAGWIIAKAPVEAMRKHGRQMVVGIIKAKIKSEEKPSCQQPLF